MAGVGAIHDPLRNRSFFIEFLRDDLVVVRVFGGLMTGTH